jgi:hypothetical protein
MPLDRDDTYERNARVKLMLADAVLKKAQLVPTDRQSARLLFRQLDDMLGELLGRREAPLRPAGGGGGVGSDVHKG